MQSDEVEVVEDDEYYPADDEEADGDEGSNEEVVDRSALSFNLHSQSVFCCELSGDSRLAVSGGEDDRAFVWKTEDGSLLFECTGHADSVIVAKFNCSSKLLATGDMKGLIKVWDLQTASSVADFIMEELTWLVWHPVLENVFLHGTVDGVCFLNKMNRSYQSDLKAMIGNTAALDGLLLSDGRRLVVGYENGDVRLWNLKDGASTFCSKENDLNNQVTALAVRPDNSVAAVGYLNSKLKLINLRTGRAVFENKREDGEEENSVEALAFCSGLPILVVGYLNGELDLWDLNSLTKRDSIKLPGGITKLALHPSQDHLLFVSSIDGTIRSFDVRDLRPLNEYTGHRESVLDFIVSKQNNFILSCSDDSTCKLFRID